MKKRIRTALASVLLLALTLQAATLPLYASEVHTYTGSENETIIYEFLKNELGTSDAVTCGILANLYYESSFKTGAEGQEADGSISYGICQWNGGRKSALISFCAENGYAADDIYGQLYYMKYELENGEKSAYNRVLAAEDTAQGAFDAAYSWAAYYERCAKAYYEMRACLARDSFWNIYGAAGRILTLRGLKCPSELKLGSGFPVYGSVSSPYPLISLNISLRSVSGEELYGYTYKAEQVGAGSCFYNLHDADKLITFNYLPEGNFIYYVSAADCRGFELEYSSPITVRSGDTVSEYMGETAAHHNHDNSLGYSWDGGTEIIPATSDEDGLMLYTCFCGESKAETIPMLTASYLISYDACGGEDAPLLQGKADGVPVSITRDEPVREGYTFLGWSENPGDTVARYIPGGEFSGNYSVTLYAVWEKERVRAESVTISTERLTLVTGSRGLITATVLPLEATDRTVSYSSSDESVLTVSSEGELTALAPGSATVTVRSPDGAYAECAVTVTDISEHIPGDINGDRRVNSQDITRLMKLLAGEPVIALSPDVNGDSAVNSKDVTRLMRYMAGEPVELF